MRFNLKTLLAVVTLVSVWLGLQLSSSREQKKAVQQIGQHDGWVAYDYQFVNGDFDATARSSVPMWLSEKLGDDFFHSVAEVSFHLRRDSRGSLEVRQNPNVLPLEKLLSGVPRTKCLRLWGTQVTDENLAALDQLVGLESLVITDAVNITDEGAARLARLRHLQWLVLTKSQITDKSLEVFSRLPTLKVLNLESKNLSGEGLQYLANSRRLEKLFVHGTNDQLNAVDDEAIMSLCSTNLSFLGIKNTHVTDGGMSSFMAKCPSCKVQR